MTKKLTVCLFVEYDPNKLTAEEVSDHRGPKIELAVREGLLAAGRNMFECRSSLETETKYIITLVTEEPLYFLSRAICITQRDPLQPMAEFICDALNAYVRTIPGQEAGRKLNLFKEPTSDAT